MSFTFRLSSHCNKSFCSCSDSWFISSAFRPDKTDLIRWIYGSAICQLFIEFFLAKNSIWQKRSYEITHRIEFWLCWLLFSLFLHTIKCMFMMRMMLARELVAFCSLNKFCKKGEKGRPSSTAKIRKRFNHVLSNSLIQYKKKKRYGNHESKWEKRSLRQRFDKISVKPYQEFHYCLRCIEGEILDMQNVGASLLKSGALGTFLQIRFHSWVYVNKISEWVSYFHQLMSFNYTMILTHYLW